MRDGYRVAYDQFYSVAESRIHQAPQCLAQFDRKLFGRKTQEGRQWYDGQEVQDEHNGGLVMDGTKRNAERYKDQQKIDGIARQCLPGEVSEATRPADPRPLIFVEWFAIRVLKGTMQKRSVFVDMVIE